MAAAPFVGEILVQASPATIFALYADAPSWAAWDPDVRASSREGPFAAGSVGSITPTSGPTMAIRITRVVPDRAFDAEARLPGCRMIFEHEVEPRGAATHVVHRVIFRGPLAFVFRAVIGPQLTRGIPGTMAGLKAAAEARAASGTPARG